MPRLSTARILFQLLESLHDHCELEIRHCEVLAPRQQRVDLVEGQGIVRRSGHGGLVLCLVGALHQILVHLHAEKHRHSLVRHRNYKRPIDSSGLLKNGFRIAMWLTDGNDS
jgi:hypothetical protein